MVEKFSKKAGKKNDFNKRMEFQKNSFKALRVFLLLFIFGLATFVEANQELTSKNFESIVRPFLLGDDHFLKGDLDQIFSDPDILSSKEALLNAGFQLVCYRSPKELMVAKHPQLPGYLVKIFLDSSNRTDWRTWSRRILGAEKIRALIKKYQGEAYLKVPCKMIYRLPMEREGKNFVLIVEDMQIVDEGLNKLHFLKYPSFAQLEVLAKVISEGGLSDSHLANIPFSEDRKIAFVDTDYFDTWPVHPDWITPWLSEKNQRYWLAIWQNLIINVD